jgi:hypothetical protein
MSGVPWYYVSLRIRGLLSLDLLVDFFYFGFPVAARAKERQ